MSKNRLCPYRKTCRDICYGENPCAFALAFDGLSRKIDRKTVCIESLRADKSALEAELSDARAQIDTLEHELDATVRLMYDHDRPLTSTR